MSKRLIILIIVGILFCTACFYIWNFFTGPVYSLYKSRKAIEQHDFQKFQEYINLDSIIDNFAFNMKVPNPEPEDTLEKLEMELGIGILYGLKPQMTKIIRKQLKKSIEGGHLDYLFDEAGRHVNSETNLYDKWRKWHSFRFSKIEYVKKTGDIALIGIKCNLYKSNNEFIFKIKMRKKGLHWQVVELTDFLNMGKMIE